MEVFSFFFFLSQAPDVSLRKHLGRETPENWEEIYCRTDPRFNDPIFEGPPYSRLAWYARYGSHHQARLSIDDATALSDQSIAKLSSSKVIDQLPGNQL